MGAPHGSLGESARLAGRTSRSPTSTAHEPAKTSPAHDKSNKHVGHDQIAASAAPTTSARPFSISSPRTTTRCCRRAPLVPRHDPTLMFTNAGMVPFKNVLTGQEKPRICAWPRRRNACAPAASTTISTMSATPRATTPSSRCSAISPSATISRSARSCSPGSCSPRTSRFAKDRLLITVYADDDEAASLWRKISGFPESKIIRIAGSDNFWSMGDIGPCGPCSEIFYDHGPGLSGAPPGAGEDGDRFVEIWNLVFMQYEQLDDGRRVDLPHPSIDTGMGLERIAAVLQGTHDNYAIDLFRALIAASVDLTGVPAERRACRQPSHHRRSSARLLLPHRRRRAAVERGQGLCASPHHAPRHAACASARRQGAAALPAGAGADRARWAAPITSSSAARR